MIFLTTPILRHDTETVHKRQGLIVAVLVSDLMIFEIFTQLAKYESSELTKTKIAKLMNYISKAANLTIKGEFLEAKYATKSSFSEEEYLEVAKLKTGSLFAATAASGALVGGASDEIVDSMYRFGLNLGIAFQIRDDILDVSGNQAQLGKPVLKRSSKQRLQHSFDQCTRKRGRVSQESDKFNALQEMVCHVRCPQPSEFAE